METPAKANKGANTPSARVRYQAKWHLSLKNYKRRKVFRKNGTTGDAIIISRLPGLGSYQKPVPKLFELLNPSVLQKRITDQIIDVLFSGWAWSDNKTTSKRPPLCPAHGGVGTWGGA